MNTSTLSLTIQLPKFEGPLALLLYLIRKEEMDIFDIEIHRITAQYLEFIRLMKELDLEVAGEFIAMASTLIQIKSRMLLPQYNEQGEIVESEDPRKELVQRLLEYQKYQEAGKMLYDRPILGRDVWARGTREKFEERILEEIELEENALYSLITSYRKMYRAAAKRVHKVAAKAQSIASRILEIKDRLLVGIRVAMSTLIDPAAKPGEDKRRAVLITFLSALELAKMGLVRLFQSDTYQEIHIEATKVIEASSVSSVEEYESLHNEDGNAAASLEPLRVDMVPEDAPEQLAFDTNSPETNVPTDGDGDFVLREEGDEESLDTEFAADEIASDDEILAAELALDGVVLDEAPVAVAPTELINPNLDALELPATPVEMPAEVTESESSESSPAGEAFAVSETEAAESMLAVEETEPEIAAHVTSEEAFAVSESEVATQTLSEETVEAPVVVIDPADLGTENFVTNPATATETELLATAEENSQDVVESEIAEDLTTLEAEEPLSVALIASEQEVTTQEAASDEAPAGASTREPSQFAGASVFDPELQAAANEYDSDSAVRTAGESIASNESAPVEGEQPEELTDTENEGSRDVEV